MTRHKETGLKGESHLKPRCVVSNPDNAIIKQRAAPRPASGAYPEQKKGR